MQTFTVLLSKKIKILSLFLGRSMKQTPDNLLLMHLIHNLFLLLCMVIELSFCHWFHLFLFRLSEQLKHFLTTCGVFRVEIIKSACLRVV